MARIRVAETKEWTQALTTALAAAGHEVTSDRATVEFLDASTPLEGQEDVLTLIVAGPDQGPQAIDACKRGAYAFLRYPFAADEVSLLVERAIDHQALAHEAHELRRQLAAANHHAEPEAPAVTGSSGSSVATVAKNLAGKPLADIEKQVILSTLEQFKGHRVRTATALGIGVRTLGMKLKRWREEGEPIISRSTSPANAQRPVPANT